MENQLTGVNTPARGVINQLNVRIVPGGFQWAVVEIYNQSTRSTFKLGGRVLKLASGNEYTVPTTESPIGPREKVAIDFSGGGYADWVTRQVDQDKNGLPDYSYVPRVIVAEKSPGVNWADDDFFDHAITEPNDPEECADLIALVDIGKATDPYDDRILDCMAWGKQTTLPDESNPLVAMTLEQEQWLKYPDTGEIHFIPNTFWAYRRTWPDAVDRPGIDNSAYSKTASYLWSHGVFAPGFGHDWNSPENTGWERRILGTVFDAADPEKPIPNARVDVLMPDGRTVVGTQTNDDGEYAAELPKMYMAGKFNLRVSADGYMSDVFVVRKFPSEQAFADAPLTAIVPGANSLTTLVRSGSVITDPNGKWSVRFPALSRPREIRFTYRYDPPLSADSIVMQESADGYRFMHKPIGCLDVAPTDGTPLVLPPGQPAWVTFTIEDPFSAREGSQILFEAMDEAGRVTPVPSATAFIDQGALKATAAFSHFSTAGSWERMQVRRPDGKWDCLFIRDSGKRSPDRDQDGDVDFFDSPKNCCDGLCPGSGSCTIKYTLEVKITASRNIKGGGWTVGGELGSGQLVKWFVDAKLAAGYQFGRTDKSFSKTHTIRIEQSITLSYDLPLPPPGEPPDKENLCAVATFQIFEVSKERGGSGGGSHCVTLPPRGTKLPVDYYIAVPAGVDRERTISGHCP